MGKKLTRTVGPLHNDEDGQDYIFEAGQELPSWAESKVSNPAAFEDDDTYASAAERDAALNERGRALRRVSADDAGSAKSSGSSRRSSSAQSDK